jgi:hypothetical protein
VRGVSALIRLATIAALAAVIAPACSLGQGTGTCSGTLNVPDCWSGPFDLHPDFFAAVPGANPHYPTTSDSSLQIRIQNGDFYETFNDGILILVDDAGEVRGDPAPDGTPRPSLLGQSLVVSLPPGVVPPGVPITPVASPPIVHAALYLDRTCRTQNDALYAMASVSGVDPASGECLRPEGGQTSLTCPGPAIADGGTSSDASVDAGPIGGADAGAGAGGDASVASGASGGGVGGTTGTSTITFTSLFDGNPDEADAAKRLSEASFNFYFADPREMCSGGLGAPPPCRGHLAGNFKFYFERGRPAQPFP